MRPATAREATVPWLNESRCARQNLENASHGQADCLAFFVCPWCVPPTERRTHQMSVHRSNRSQGHIEATASTADVHVVDHHSIVLFQLNTREASAWIEENVAGEAQFFGTALVVEPRYVPALLAGMRESGLEVAS